MKFDSSAQTRLCIAVLAVAALAASPVLAGRRHGGYHGGYYGGHYGHHDNHSGGLVAALIGAVVVTGLISAATSSNRDNRTAYPRGYAPVPPAGQTAYTQAPYSQAPGGFERPLDDNSAATAQVELCSRAAERAAQNSGGDVATVTIDGIDGNPANAQVRGTVEYSQGNTGGTNRASFICSASYGQVTGVRFG